MKHKAHEQDKNKSLEEPVDSKETQEAVPDTVPAEGTAGTEVESLRKELEQKAKETTELHDRVLRNQAELENFRKRMLKERLDVVRYATEELIGNLLPVLDDFERGIEAADSTKDFNALMEGVKLIFNQLKEVLQKAGLTEVAALGEPFDPKHHEAVRVIESDEHDDSIVVEELRKGYNLNDRVLRPAMVTVSKK